MLSSLDSLEAQLASEQDIVKNRLEGISSELELISEHAEHSHLLTTTRSSITDLKAIQGQIEAYVALAKPVYDSAVQMNENCMSTGRLAVYIEVVTVIERLSSEAVAALETPTQMPTAASLSNLSQPFLKLFKLYKALRCTCVQNLVQVLQQRLFVLAKRIKMQIQDYFTRTMVKLGWPLTRQGKLQLDELIVKEFCQLLLQLIDVQDAFEELERHRDPSVMSDAKRTSSSPTQWMMNLLVAPIAERFQYHFSGKKATNRLEKPEWMFQFILDQIEWHHDFLAQGVQYVVEQSSLKHRGYRATHAFIEHLIELLKAKLERVIPRLLKVDVLLRHAIDETIVFERTLREKYDFGVSYEGCMGVLTNTPEHFKAWLSVDRQFINDNLEAIRVMKHPWQPYQPDTKDEIASEKIMIPTRSARALVDLVHGLEERFAYIPKLRHRLLFVEGLQMKLLQLYIEDIDLEWRANRNALVQSMDYDLSGHVSSSGVDGKTDKDVTEHSIDNTWQRHCGLLNTVLYVREVLRDWSDKLLFLELSLFKQEHFDPSSTSSDLFAQEEAKSLQKENFKTHTGKDVSLFDGLIEEYRGVQNAMISALVQDVSISFEKQANSYIRSRVSEDNDADDDVNYRHVSPSLCAGLATIKLLVILAERYLCKQLFQDFWTGLVNALDTHVQTNFIADGYFEHHSRKQFTVDMEQGLFAVFKPYTRTPGKYFTQIMLFLNGEEVQTSPNLTESVALDDLQDSLEDGKIDDGADLEFEQGEEEFELEDVEEEEDEEGWGGEESFR